MLADTAPLQKILGSPIPAFIIKEISEALPAMVFFAIGFNLIVLTTNSFSTTTGLNWRPSWLRP